jgi:hypothetical protein
MSEKKTSHEVERIAHRALRHDCVKPHIWGRVKNISAALKVPKNTVASIFLKWKKFGTTKTLSRAGRLAKLRNRGRRALVREVTKNPMVTLTELQFLCGDGRTFQKDNHLHQLGLCGRVARRKPLLSKRHMTARLEFAKRQN